MSEFYLPDTCGYCGRSFSKNEAVELEDYKLYHSTCFIKLQDERTLKILKDRRKLNDSHTGK